MVSFKNKKNKIARAPLALFHSSTNYFSILKIN